MSTVIEKNKDRVLGQPALVEKDGEWVASTTIMVLQFATFLKRYDEKNVVVISLDPFSDERKESMTLPQAFFSEEILQAFSAFEQLSQ